MLSTKNCQWGFEICDQKHFEPILHVSGRHSSQQVHIINQALKRSTAWKHTETTVLYKLQEREVERSLEL